MSRNTRILLTGSHGFAGRHIARRLSDAGASVFHLDRAAPNAQNCTTVDLRHNAIEEFLPERIDTVIHAAAALPSHSREEIFETDVLATLRLLLWARKTNVRQFVHISSTAVYGPQHPAQVQETAIPNPWDAYNTAKIRAERLVQDVLCKTLTQWTILRPKAIVGPGRLGLFGHLFDFAASGKRFPIIGDGTAVYQFLHVDDFVEAVQLTLDQSAEADQRILNIASRADHSIAELFQDVLDQAGYGKQLLRVPQGVAVTTLSISHVTGLSPVYSRLIRNLTHGSTVSLAAAKEAIGFSPRHSGLSALQDSFDWYRRASHATSSSSIGPGHQQVWNSPLTTLVKALI